MEEWGTGIPRIINRCREYGLENLIFEEFGDGFRFTLIRKVGNAFDEYMLLLEAVDTTDIFIKILEKFTSIVVKKQFLDSRM